MCVYDGGLPTAEIKPASRRTVENVGNLGQRRGGDADAETARLERLDHLAGGVADQDQPAGLHVLLHRSPQRVLRLPRQLVHVGQDHHLERRRRAGTPLALGRVDVRQVIVFVTVGLCRVGGG